MSGTCVVGLQWGDEAKGKIVDRLGDRHDVAVRYNGGPNAGHTIVHSGKTFKLSLLPTGTLRPELLSVIGNGVVVHPSKLLDEIDQLHKAGLPVGENLRLSDHAHVIFPYHVEEEQAGLVGGQIGTTGRGIGPCYQDKVGRAFAIRVGELLRPEHLRDRLREILPHKTRFIQALSNVDSRHEEADPDRLADRYAGYGERLRPFITDTHRLLQEAVKAGKRMLFEGAQGSLLDVDHGTYPYVTSSTSLPAGIWPGCGVSSRKLDRIIGVAKAYTTRVGSGPFPTELHDAIGERIREVGREYGTVTGRPRRVGWFDAVAVRYTTELADVDEMVLSLLDVLSGHDQVFYCEGYELDGERIDRFPSETFRLGEVVPILTQLPGWSEDITTARSWNQLPDNARRYVDRIEEVVGVRVSMISIGPDREQTIER